jgi:crossover junction endodeoxyribonuclease RuvC
VSTSQNIRILGIDPGSRITGYGVVDFVGQKLTHISSGCIRTKGDDLAGRLKQIHAQVLEIVAQYQPQEAAIERVFVARNPSSALKLGQARGAAIVACASADAPLFEYSPNEIKQAITGRGHAEKQQIQHMIKILLALTKSPATDAADALAVAICHGNIRESRARIEKARQKAGLSA